MKLEKVREMKALLLKELADLEAVETEAVKVEFTKYADRLVTLMNKVEMGSDFCISFIPEGKTQRVNVLPPSLERGDFVLRELALAAILLRLEKRVTKDGLEIVVTSGVSIEED